MKKRPGFDLLRFWNELRRRRVVRVALYYAAFAWIVLQVADNLLHAFDVGHVLRFVVAALLAAFPLVLVLAWVFDITPRGIERTPDLPGMLPAPGVVPPESSVAVLPFVNLSGDAENEYFSDGLAEEIRNQLAKVAGLRVAARTSSFAFKGRHDDIRDIARRLNVATVLEGGVRKHDGAVRIYVQLINALDGYQLWSETYERRLDDIFLLQSEISSAVTAAVKPLSGAEARAPAAAVETHDFAAYNLYLLGRHRFHKRTEPALQGAIECFEQAIGIDPGYALAHAGLADAHSLLSTRYYGNLPPAQSVQQALPAATRALQLAPQLAEAHAAMGLISENRGDLPAAEKSLARALELNPGYSMAHVWYALVLNKLGRFADAEACNREAFRLDPLAPIVNTNVGFDALRHGDFVLAAARFSAAIEVEPSFPVPYYGLSRVHATRGEFAESVQHIEMAIQRAPQRGFYQARKGLLMLQLERTDEAAQAIALACRLSADNPLYADLVVALHIVRDDRDSLRGVASGQGGPMHGSAQRAQAWIALGDLDAARDMYEQNAVDRQRELNDLMTDDWIWRLPHVVNRAHLRLLAGDERGRTELLQLLEELKQIGAQGIVSSRACFWRASAHAVLGQHEQARTCLHDATQCGWHHGWWERHDWNIATSARRAVAATD